MNTKQKNIFQQTGSWARVALLSASTLAPVVNAALERIRAQQKAEQAVADYRNADRKEKVAAFASDVQSDMQERLQLIGSSLADVLEDLRDRSVNQDLWKRANGLTEDFIERSNKFSRELAERGGDFSQELAKRSRKAQQNIAEQDRSFWIALGFGCGLTAAGIVTFVLVRKRLRHAEEDDESPIQLSYDSNRSAIHISQPQGEIHAIRTRDRYPESHPFGEVITVADHDGPVSTRSAEELADGAQSTPTDATFVGLASTKQYYPVETPLDQLADADGKPVDVIYFSSEKEAQAQGFTAASV
ncbi:hypothetical protein [Dictyobacter kobayashii]|uniref:Uncharacterized protein n=1 Tax=Dictyobacter kobayashii TaxID=2014872 RepID=A0A402AIP0_9CHLR|nr:hypothetical protein [Dictyobacter kobayashii]GCE18992.1 hypothetical protein KDK_27920 [Dictyobacter kobayashii]